MKKYIKSSISAKIPYELLGYVVNDLGYYAKIFLDTYAVSEAQAISNFRNQIYTNPEYAG